MFSEDLRVPCERRRSTSEHRDIRSHAVTRVTPANNDDDDNPTATTRDIEDVEGWGMAGLVVLPPPGWHLGTSWKADLMAIGVVVMGVGVGGG